MKQIDTAGFWFHGRRKLNTILIQVDSSGNDVILAAGKEGKAELVCTQLSGVPVYIRDLAPFP
jgi:hypothetical protein